ncbi:Uncharacterized protein OBRU01_21458 [Operophtera brumata]|uniref:Uncharacterized protein n=1 Tax=Operophtera brumata TaxID=104452 RepID=A0A0L7KT38_OPEBR|nr:Uncharacterized protein OBRU01_21458 [Operophtera brumata]
MARATRVALDLVLVSLNTVRPVISKVWGAAKNVVTNTPARPLVANPVIPTIESTLDKLANMLVDKLTVFRNARLAGELKYLEAELEKVQKPALATAWQYAKVECAPPMVGGFINGPVGKKLEDTVSKATDNFISGIAQKIKDMDAEEERAKNEKEAAIKAAQEKIKADEAKLRKDEAIKALGEQKAKEKVAAKKAEEAKKTEVKAEVKKVEKPKKPPPPKKK